MLLDPNRIECLDEDGYDEERWRLIGKVEEFVLLVICTFRQDRIRISSARKATKNECLEYWNGQIPA